MAFDTWLAFFLACWVISLSPGAGAVASMSSGLSFGFRRGYWLALGLQLALLLQIAVVAAGLGALLIASEAAFSLLKWCGVAYLLYLGWRQWRAAANPVKLMPGSVDVSSRQLVLRGFLVNASNPKAIVFILAVLPQFIDPGQALLPQYLSLALTMVSVDLVVMAGYTGLAARVLCQLRNPRQLQLLNRVFGALFGAAALLLAAVRQSSR